ncbi:MAG: radical SAM protein [Chloroflexia bacterium]|nr:radical SAM protein [Chloroflexia bacterium]
MDLPGYDFANILLAGPCNLRCPYCIGRQLDPALNCNVLDRFPLPNLERFAGLLRRHGVRQIVLTGSNTDPQLYRHEARLLDWLRRHVPGARISLHTNGQLALRNMDVLNRYDRVSLSLPAFDAGTYEKMTGSRRVPDLAAIVRAARVPLKISCLVNEHNAPCLGEFLERCHVLGLRRLVLRRLYGETRRWELPAGLRLVGHYRQNPVYDYRGMEVTYWDFGRSSSTSLNLFSDGTISGEYLLVGRGVSDSARPALRPGGEGGATMPGSRLGCSRGGSAGGMPAGLVKL